MIEYLLTRGLNNNKLREQISTTDFSKFLNKTGTLTSATPLAIRRLHFISKCLEKFGDAYDFTTLKFTSTKDNLSIECPIHGLITMPAKSFLRSHVGCALCGRKVK